MSSDVSSLRAAVAGDVLSTADPGYAEATSLFNARITAKPRFVVRCVGVEDVQRTVLWAREAGLPLSVRGGGHGVHGLALVEDGVVIDLRAMNGVTVDPELGQAQVGGGARWADVYDAAARHDLAPVGGTETSVGVAGFTMGSGNSWLMRRHGLACDNTLSFTLVTAEGQIVTADATQPDLLWALRGGGGNFGVVTEMALQLHPVPSRMTAGITYYDIASAERSLAGYRDIMESASRDTAAIWALAPMPDDPRLPEPLRARTVVLVAMMHVGSAADGEVALAGLRQLGTPLVDTVGEVPFGTGIRLVDGVAPWGLLNYWRGLYLNALDDTAIETIIRTATARPEIGLQVFRMGGAVDDVPESSTAIPRSGRGYFFGLASAWTDPSDSEKIIAATDAAGDAVARWTSGACPNHVDRMSHDDLRAALGPAVLERLRRVKHEFDPENVFASNQNIVPGR